jgi:hypothetical protein
MYTREELTLMMPSELTELYYTEVQGLMYFDPEENYFEKDIQEMVDELMVHQWENKFGRVYTEQQLRGTPLEKLRMMYRKIYKDIPPTTIDELVPTILEAQQNGF